MSFDLSQRIRVSSKHANIDERYGPYASITEALGANSLASRGQGRVFGIIENGKVVDYWFPTNDVTDNALEKKNDGGSAYVTTIFKSVTMSDIGAEESETEEAITQKLATWIENQNFVIPEGEIWAFELEREGTDDASDKLSKTTTSSQSVESQVEFKKDISVGGWYYWGDKNRNILYSGVSATIPNSSNISGQAFTFGSNIFPSFDLKSEPEAYYNKNFLGIGDTIFPDYTGNSNYRPSHNAHDSWVGVGFGLGKGLKDGTNITMVGTGNMTRNEVKYADSVTIVGKGNTSGYPTGQDPDRVINAVNGFSVRDMMSDVIMIGHENWVGAINNSTVLGSNLRLWKYVFNSVVLGQHTFNYNTSGNQSNAFLDSDIILGNGIYKRLDRHKESHNLLIGMDYTYVTGTPPNANYRPLIEGRFKDEAQLQVNGTIIGGFEKLDDDLPYLERVTFESVSLPSGVVYNASERSFTFDGTQASTSITLHNIPANPNKYIYIEISGSNHTAGSWGYSVYNAVDSGNGPTDNFVARQTFKTTSPTTFILTTEGNFKGTIHIICDYTDVTLRSINPNILLKDSKERKTFEIRTTQDPSIVSIGLNSGKFLTHGGKTLILGNDILSETPAATDNVLVGSNIFKLGDYLRNNVVLGNAIGGNNTKLSHSVIIGNDTLQSNFTNNVARLTIVGHGAGKALTAGTYNNLFGEIAGLSLTTGSSNAFFGSASGLIKEGSNNTFIGHAAGGYGLMQSTVNNTIVIGANAVPEVPNNTTTIANASNTDNFLYGAVHANSFKVRGGTGENVLLDNGTVKSLSEINAPLVRTIQDLTERINTLESIIIT